jgi:hypothetical protein
MPETPSKMDNKTETENPHPSYLKGFNEGYTLHKYMPELAQEIALALKNSERGMGFKEGYSQYLVDKHQVKEKLADKSIEQNNNIRMPDWLSMEEPEQHETPSEEKEMDDQELELD